jgi:Fic family protein
MTLNPCGSNGKVFKVEKHIKVMAYIEERKFKEKSYYYFIKRFSFRGTQHSIKKLIGNSSNLSKEKYLLDNLQELSKKELEIRKKYLEQLKQQLSHKESLPEQVELKSIKITNYLEGKNCKDFIYTEFAKEFIFNSNNIEGSKIPPERVKEIIDKGETKYKERNEVKEVENSIKALKYLQDSFKFNISSIKRLYHILTENLFREGNQHYPKGFKKESNIVGNSSTTSPENVEKELKSLLTWYKNNKKKIHPFILAFEFHARYERIHPFLDGNGRTGRLIMNKILMNEGYFPIIVYKSNKLAYFNALEKIEKTKNYYQFMLEQASKTYDFILETISKY